MLPLAFTRLLQQADESGSRSTVLKTPSWMVSVSIVGLVSASSGYIAAPSWVIGILAALVCISLGWTIWAYVYFALRGREDALRSERYSIQKLAIEKGLVGDSLRGLFVPDSPSTSGQLIDDFSKADRGSKMRRFVIATAGLDARSELAFAQFLNSKGGSWWHWIENFWLFVTENETITAEAIRDWLINKTGNDQRSVVIEFTDYKTWAGARPEKEVDAFEWMHRVWKPKKT